MSAPLIRRVRNDLFFVEWGNVRFGGTFSELATFAAELQKGMTKALAGDPENRTKEQERAVNETLLCRPSDLSR